MVVDLEGFGDEVAAFLVEARILAESRMTDRCLVEYKSGETAQNEQTGVVEDVYAPLFESKCWIGGPSYANAERQVGGRLESVASATFNLPWDMPAVTTNNRIRLIEIAPDSPARSLGKPFYISVDYVDTQRNRTRLTVKEDPWLT